MTSLPHRQSALRVRAVRSFEALAPLALHLDALNLASRRALPFDTFGYLRCHYEHDEQAEELREPLLLLAEDGPELLGYLPLCRFRERVLGRLRVGLRLLATHDHDRPRLVSRPEDEARCASAFYRFLLDQEPDWSQLTWSDQDETSPLVPPIADVELGACAVRSSEGQPNATVPLGKGSLADYFRSLDRKHRTDVRAHARRLLSGRALSWVHSAEPRARRSLFELYLDLERRSWKAGTSAAIERDPRRVAFFRALVGPEQAAELSVGLLLLDGVPIAGGICCQYGGGTYCLEQAYDQQVRELAPGKVLLPLVIREALNRGDCFLNLLGSFVSFKARWGAIVTPTRSVQLIRKPSLHFARTLLTELAERLRPAGQRLPGTPGARRAPRPPASRAELATRAAPVLAALPTRRTEWLEGSRLRQELGEGLDLRLPRPHRPASHPAALQANP